MSKVDKEKVFNYPLVGIFYNNKKSDGRVPDAVHEAYLVKSNGIQMICCEADGNVFLVNLSEVGRVSPRNNDYWVCRFDPESGNIEFRSQVNGDRGFTGPVRGTPDPSVDLRQAAAQLGVSFDDLVDSVPEIDSRAVEGVACSEIAHGPVERDAQELLGFAPDVEEDMDFEDLDALFSDLEGGVPSNGDDSQNE